MNESAKIETLSFLECAASDWRNGDSRDEHLPGLMAICRKVDIGRRLFASYRPDWKNPDGDRLLDRDEWLQAMALLVDYVEHESRRAYRLKLINTLLKGIDIMRCDASLGAELEDRIAALEGRVRELMEG